MSLAPAVRPPEADVPPPAAPLVGRGRRALQGTAVWPFYRLPSHHPRQALD
jgi:hypothetical protein